MLRFACISLWVNINAMTMEGWITPRHVSCGPCKQVYMCLNNLVQTVLVFTSELIAELGDLLLFYTELEGTHFFNWFDLVIIISFGIKV